MDGDEKHEARWIVPREERHADLDSLGKARGRKCPSTIVSSFFAIVTWMLSDDKPLDVTFTFSIFTFCYQIYIERYTILSVIPL